MTFSYSGDPGKSKLDLMRFTIGDTDENRAILQDEEIAYILATHPSESKQLAVAFRQCASFFAARLVKRSLGPQSEDASKRQEYYTEMANKCEKGLTYAGVPPLPAYSSEKVFEKGMMSGGA